MCFVAVVQASERCNNTTNVSTELPSALPGSPALAAASHPSETRVGEPGWGRVCMISLETAEQNLGIPSAAFSSSCAARAGLLVQLRFAQGSGSRSIARPEDTCRKVLLGSALSK